MENFHKADIHTQLNNRFWRGAMENGLRRLYKTNSIEINGGGPVRLCAFRLFRNGCKFIKSSFRLLLISSWFLSKKVQLLCLLLIKRKVVGLYAKKC